MTEDRLVATIEQRRSGARVIKLAGVLDEHNGLGELIEKVGTGRPLINLSGVERINSTGTRDWMNWLASLEERGIRPVLIACSPAVVAQLNRIKKFAGNGIVKSFQVPYHCSTCNADKRLLVHVADMTTPPYRPPECICDACGAAMAFVDESGADYFAFLRELPKLPPERPSEREVELARGSSSAITVEHVKRISQPRVASRQSRPSLSAFQVPEPKRISEGEILTPRAMPAAGGAYVAMIILIVAALLGTVAVMLYMLLAG